MVVAASHWIMPLAHLAAALLVVSCVPAYPVRPEIGQACGPSDEKRADCALEVHPGTNSFYLHVVEFNDTGLYSSIGLKQKDNLMEFLSESEDEDHLIVLFVHGWCNNAADDNEYVIGFRSTLKFIADDERRVAENRKTPPRKVVGVYVGWRGLSWAYEDLCYLTFGSREESAITIGHGQLYELLLTLEKFRHENNPERDKAGTQLILTGHSLGAAMLYHAISHDLRRRTLLSADCDPVEPFGSLIILVNPALTDQSYRPLREISEKKDCYNAEQLPILMVANSENDKTIQWVFGFLQGLLCISKDPGLECPTTLGPPTHRLDLLKDHTPPSYQSKCGPPEIYRDKALTLLDCENRKSRIPYMIIRVSEDILPDHGSIFEREFVEFLRLYVEKNASRRELVER